MCVCMSLCVCVRVCVCTCVSAHMYMDVVDMSKIETSHTKRLKHTKIKYCVCCRVPYLCAAKGYDHALLFKDIDHRLNFAVLQHFIRNRDCGFNGGNCWTRLAFFLLNTFLVESSDVFCSNRCSRLQLFTLLEDTNVLYFLQWCLPNFPCEGCSRGGVWGCPSTYNQPFYLLSAWDLKWF